MNTTSPPSRRWLRFSLRALLAVITIICCWLAWETRAVQNRKALRKEAEAAGYNFQTAAQHAAQIEDYVLHTGGDRSTFAAPTRVSLVRQMLGDEAIQQVWFYGPGLPDEKVKQLIAAFPEAEFREVHPEPCHPGCFPSGTLVETQDGPREIQTIAVGDVVTTVLPSGETGSTKVQTIFATKNLLWEVKTADGTFVTTETQPLCLTDGGIRQAGKLEPGDKLRQWYRGDVREVEVLHVASIGKTAQVFNLILGDGEIFIAGGYLARSKPPALPINE